MIPIIFLAIMSAKVGGLFAINVTTFDDTNGYGHVIGVLKNNSTGNYTLIDVTAMLYNKKGELIGVPSTYVGTIYSDHITPFEILIRPTDIKGGNMTNIDKYNVLPH